MSNLSSRIHTWSIKLANTNRGSWALFVCAFADASFLPLPITTFFMLLVLMNTDKAYKYAFFNTLGTVAGAFAGYLIGHFAWFNASGEFTAVANFLFSKVPGISEALYNQIHVLFLKWNGWILVIATLSPIPYSLFSVSSGVFEINIFIFLIVTLICQGIKFFLLAHLTKLLGPKVKMLLDFGWRPVAIITSLSLIIAIVVFRVL